MPKENRYNITLSECGYDDFGYYDSWIKEIKNITEEQLQWYQENSKKMLSDGGMFQLWSVQKR